MLHTRINERKNSAWSNVHDAPKQGYLTKGVRSFYVNLKDALSDSQEINVAMKS